MFEVCSPHCSPSVRKTELGQPKSDQCCVEFGQHWPDSGQDWRTVGQLLTKVKPNTSHVWPTSADLRPNAFSIEPRIARCRPMLGRVRPISARNGQEPSYAGRISAKLRQEWADVRLARFRPTLGHPGPRNDTFPGAMIEQRSLDIGYD